jgi:hypothetical protein
MVCPAQIRIEYQLASFQRDNILKLTVRFKVSGKVVTGVRATSPRLPQTFHQLKDGRGPQFTTDRACAL